MEVSLKEKRCIPCEGGMPALDAEQVAALLKDINEWQVNDNGDRISRDFRFKNYYRTIEFVNALAWIANQEQHHPDLEVSYNHCQVSYQTHAINGLSENDFICAAKIDSLMKVA